MSTNASPSIELDLDVAQLGRVDSSREVPSRSIATRRRWQHAALVACFGALSLLMAMPRPDQLTTRIAGDGGDALFVTWTLTSVDRALVHGWSALWNLPIFAGTPNVLAYSDSLLPLAPIFGFLEGLTGSAALAVNLIALSAWTLTQWWTYRLARWLRLSAPAAVFAAVAFTFSTAHLAQYRHLQLIAGGAITGVVLLTLRLADRPTLPRGIGLALAVLLLALTASYLGLIAAVVIAVVLPASTLRRRSSVEWRPLVRAVVAAAIVGVALAAPFALRYHRVTADPMLHRRPDHQFDLAPTDLVAVSVDNRHVQGWWPVRGHAFDKTSENWLFPGYTTTVLAVAGAVPLWRRRGARPIVLAAGACAVIALGDVAIVHGHVLHLPLSHLRALPGFDGIRAPTRFFVIPTLVLATAAGAGVQHVLRRVPSRAHPLIVVALTGAFLFESATRIETTPVDPTRPAAAVNHALATRIAGTVVELPMRTSVDGAAWPFVEVPRQLAATIDGHPRLNGHSGYEPPGWPALAATVNTFPDARALDALAAHDVRYVVLRTAVPIDLGERAVIYDRPGVGVLSVADAEQRIAALPRDRLRSVERVGDAYLIELSAPGRPWRPTDRL